MVLLTVTPLILEGLKELENDVTVEGSVGEDGEESHEAIIEPLLLELEIGRPISHARIIDLSRDLKANGYGKYTLESLLKGSHIYIPPSPPKPEPTSEYKALMARLRQEQESRAYQQMTQSPQSKEAFSRRFPSPSTYDLHNSTEEDEITYSDVNRQMTLIINIIISIVCSSAALWVAARHWSTIARLSLSMSGSILVAVAEVVIYSGYMRQLGDAKSKEEKLKEVKEIVNTWVVGGEESEKSQVIVSGQEDETTSSSLRNRGKVKDTQ